MIGSIRSAMGKAGLACGSVRTEELDGLPEPAVFQDGVLYLDAKASDDAKLKAGAYAIAADKFDQLDDDAKMQWEQGLALATAAQVSLATDALQRAQTYEEAVESLDSPVDRLVAIHLYNALISSGMSCEEAKSVDFSEWGSTSGLANGDKPYSLRPLLGAYVSHRVRRNFPDAVAALVAGENVASHSSVAAEFKTLIQSVFN